LRKAEAKAETKEKEGIKKNHALISYNYATIWLNT